MTPGRLAAAAAIGASDRASAPNSAISRFMARPATLGTENRRWPARWSSPVAG
jgi:hypothetical protein